MAFHRPEKDMCTMCSGFDEMENKTEERKRLYKEHRDEANRVRSYRDRLKEVKKKTQRLQHRLTYNSRYHCFLNFKNLCNTLINLSKTASRDVVKYMNIRRYSVRKADPCINISIPLMHK